MPRKFWPIEEDWDQRVHRADFQATLSGGVTFRDIVNNGMREGAAAKEKNEAGRLTDEQAMECAAGLSDAMSRRGVSPMDVHMACACGVVVAQRYADATTPMTRRGVLAVMGGIVAAGRKKAEAEREGMG